MSVTQDYKESNSFTESQAVEVGKILNAEGAHGAYDDNQVKVARALALEKAKIRAQAVRNGVPFPVRNMASDNHANFFGNRRYTLQQLFVIASHGTSKGKIASVAADAACIVAGCLLMMSGPILAALGWIKG